MKYLDLTPEIKNRQCMTSQYGAQLGAIVVESSRYLTDEFVQCKGNKDALFDFISFIHPENNIRFLD